MKKINNYEIRNQAGSDTAELLLYGIIGDYWDDMDAKDIVNDLRGLDVKNIIVRIYSDGGSVFAGLAIYNALKNHPADITIIIDSLAASIASVIAMSGSVHMPENAFMMIHNPSGGAWGESGAMKKMAEILDKIKESLIGVYTAKTGLDTEKVAAMMDDETWLTAKEALDLGFCDKVTGQAAPDVKNLKKVFNQLSNYKNVPERFLALVRNNQPTKPLADPAGDKEKKMEITLQLIKDKYPDIVKALMDEGAESVQDKISAEAAKKERERIQAVAAQSMPGHETLIAGLMFDGKTTGPEAAVKVLAAEKTLRVNSQKNLDDDSVPPAPYVAAKDDVNPKPSGPVTQASCKKEYEADPKLEDEYGDFETYFAFRTAVDKGQVKRLIKEKK